MRSPKKPTAQKELEGTTRADRTNPREPKYEAAIPPAPDCLDKVAAAEWRRVGAELHAQRVLARTDMAVMTAYCVTWSVVCKLTGLFNAGQAFLVTGPTTKYPVHEALLSAMARLQSLAADLGLSPASRGKVSSIAAGKEDDPATKLRQAGNARRERAERMRAEVPPN